jgi:hypothetical protein
LTLPGQQPQETRRNDGLPGARIGPGNEESSRHIYQFN